MKKSKRIISILCTISLSLVVVFAALGIGCVYTEHAWQRFSPKYERIDITPILEKEQKTQADYDVIYAQTGLTRIAVEDMMVKKMQPRILEIQDNFFALRERRVEKFNFFSRLNTADGATPMAALQDGDIIVSAATYTSWFRHGHAALVVNGATGLVLESVEAGAPSTVSGIEYLANYENFIVLRPDLPLETREQVAKDAYQTLDGIPYDISVGIFSKKYKPTPAGTHCAHIVWLAYKKFGVDLDSNGGAIVTPRDILLSPKLQIVQVYGLNLQSPWGKNI